MSKVSTMVKNKNAEIIMGLLSKHDGNEYINCAQISYYVDDDLQFKQAGEIMINRRDNYPKLQILSPSTGDYTESFQENSCTFTDLCNLDTIMIETSYVPYKIGKQVKVKVVITL